LWRDNLRSLSIAGSGGADGRSRAFAWGQTVSLHPSRDGCRLDFLCTKIKSAAQIKGFPAEAGLTERARFKVWDRLQPGRDLLEHHRSPIPTMLSGHVIFTLSGT
jgi:hypothetical protein